MIPHSHQQIANLAPANHVLSERPSLGAAYLFPAPRDPSKPVSDLASKWLREAERLAGLGSAGGLPLAPAGGSGRRIDSTSQTAAAGGWKDTRALKTAYQQVDPATVLEVVLSPKRLRDAH